MIININKGCEGKLPAFALMNTETFTYSHKTGRAGIRNRQCGAYMSKLIFFFSSSWLPRVSVLSCLCMQMLRKVESNSSVDINCGKNLEQIA